MKYFVDKILTLILLPAVFFTTTTGCKTSQNPTGVVAIGNVAIDPRTTGDAVRIAGKLGTIAVIQKNPELRAGFQRVVIALELAIGTTNTTPESVRACFSSIIPDPIALDMLNDAIQLYSDYFGVLVANNLEKQSPYIVPVILGLSRGIREACILTAPK